MKYMTNKILSTLSGLCFLCALCVSCSSDIEQPTLLGYDSAEDRGISVSKSNVVMDGNNEEAPCVTFT